MHPLLKRQLKKIGLLDVTAPTPEQWQAFIEKVGSAYMEAEQDRQLLERSLDLSSEEMKRLYEQHRLASASRLAEERDKLQVLVQSLGVGVCALDAHGAVQVVNGVAERLLMCPSAELLGSRLFELIEILDGEQLESAISGDDLLLIVSGGNPFEHSDAWFRINRSAVIPVSFILNPVLHEGTLVGAVLVFQDITERKRNEEERAVRESLLQRSQAEYLTLAKNPAISEGNLPLALTAITESAAQLLAVSRASIWFFDQDSSTLRCADLFEAATGEHTSGATLSLDTIPRYYDAVRSEHCIVADHAQEDIQTSEFAASYLKPYGITSILDAPIQWRGQLVGVICHEHTGSPREWLPVESTIGVSLAGFVSQALEANERMKAQTALHASEERTRLIIDTALDAVVGMDETGMINDWNKQAETVFGWTRAEALGRDLADLIIPPAHREAHRRGLRQFIMTGEGPILNQRIEVTALHRNGSEFPIELAISPLKVGATYEFSAFIEDISERKQLQEDMFRTNRFLDSLIDSMPIMVCVKEAKDLTIVRWNRVAEELTGIARAEILGKSDLDFFPHAQAIDLMALDRNVLEGLTLLDIPEEPVATRQRGTRWLHTKKFPILNRDGQPQYLLAISEDITARKQAEEALQTSQARLTMTVQGSNIGIWDWDLQTNDIYYSPEWKAQLGYADREVANNLCEWDARVHPEDLPRAKELIRACLDGRQSQYEYEHRLRHKDGTYRWILARGSLSTDTATMSKRMVGIHIDVTDRKQAEEDLRLAKEAAEAASRAKSDFLANMSHEIRTPMNGVIGMTELLRSTDLTKAQRHYLDTIATSGESLLLLINDILDFSKIEAGKLELHQIDFDLRTVVETVAEQLADRAQQKGVELSCLFQATVPTALQGDPGRIRQILTNLVGNAVKFTSKGEVVVRVALEPESGPDPVAVRISVSDSGVGISPEGLSRLFRSFSQVDGSSTRQFGGTGLGLAISKQLTELMGGRIGVESAMAKGSTFWVVLPLTRQGHPQPQVEISPTVLKHARICVVENQRINQEILEHYIRSWGLQPLMARSGEEALSLLEAAAKRGEPCQAVLMDFQLPDFTGLRLARTIRSKSEWGPPPVILLTALCQRGDAEAAVQAGCAAYLSKPIRYIDLYECLLQVLGTRPATGTTRLADPPPLVTRHTLAEARGQRRFHVLVVEDNPVNQEVAALLLRNMGCRVDLASNGHEAVDAIRQTTYDLVFMDCQMPGMDGYAATREVRRFEQAEAAPRLPIIALTANALQGDREACLSAGMDDYLTKPFTKEGLHVILERWLSHRSSASQQSALPESSTGALASPSAERGSRTRGIVDQGAWKLFMELDEPGQPDSLSHFMEIFLRDTGRKMVDLREAVTAGDTAAVSKIAHSLKSVSAVLGAMRLAALYKDMEANGLSSALDPVQALFPEVEEEFQAVCSIFRDELTKRGDST